VSITYTATGWTGCDQVRVNIFGPGGSTVATGITPVNGSFSGTSAAPNTIATYQLVADSALATTVPGTTSTTVAGPTTTATGATTTSSAVSPTSAATGASGGGELPPSGSNLFPGVLAGLAIVGGLLLIVVGRLRSS